MCAEKVLLSCNHSVLLVSANVHVHEGSIIFLIEARTGDCIISSSITHFLSLSCSMCAVGFETQKSPRGKKTCQFESGENILFRLLVQYSVCSMSVLNSDKWYLFSCLLHKRFLLRVSLTTRFNLDCHQWHQRQCEYNVIDNIPNYKRPSAQLQKMEQFGMAGT